MKEIDILDIKWQVKAGELGFEVIDNYIYCCSSTGEKVIVGEMGKPAALKVHCIYCKYLMFSDSYAVCSKECKSGTLNPYDSCGKGERE